MSEKMLVQLNATLTRKGISVMDRMRFFYG
jgi:hypothetical protein